MELVPAVKSTFDVAGRKMSRTQLPIRLAWAMTIHKSQGLTLPRVRIGLGPRKFQAGLTSVALSRVKSLTDVLLIEPVDFSRVRKLGGQNLEERRRDYICRYPINVNLQ